MEKYSAFWSKPPNLVGPPPIIGFTDTTDPRILQAAAEIHRRGLARPVLIGKRDDIISASQRAGLGPLDSQMISPDRNEDEIKNDTNLLLEKQKKHNLSEDDVKKQLADPLYQGIVMLLQKQIDGLVGGSLRPTAEIVKAAIQCIGPRSGERLISGHFLIETEHRMTSDKTPFLFADCAVVPEPSSRALAAIAIGAAASYKFFTGLEARVALLSFSTRDSAVHPLVDRIKEALNIIRKQEPNLIVDGEMQVDAALDVEVAAIKNAADSPVAGHSNVFVFPTLEAGNIGYKLIQRFSKTRIAGPLLWGLNFPMSDLSRGCTIQEVVDTTQCVTEMIRGRN